MRRGNPCGLLCRLRLLAMTTSDSLIMLPVIAIVGRPNVGKSTLFNCLTRTRDALITDFPGTTRDRQFGDVRYEDRHFIVIDTGGIAEETDHVSKLITQQAQQAIADADKIMFVVDGRGGITPEDHAIADFLRRSNKSIVLVVNKTEGMDADIASTDAYTLGIGKPHTISSAHRSGIDELVEILIPEPNVENTEITNDTNIKLAIVGRPNVGKSTLTNRMLGEERVIVHDSPGTTRDSIYVPLERFGTHYTLIDTAGVRKRGKINELPEKFSVVKTLQSIEDSNVVIYVIDARIAVSEQDLKLLGFIHDSGKGLVLAINKWDGMTEDDRNHAKNTIDRLLDFVDYAKVHFISALHGSGVGNLFDSVKEAYESATKKLTTSELTSLLEKAIETHTPPLVQGRRVKLRFAHPGGNNPPTVVIHGNQLNKLPDSYRKFLAGYFIKKLKLSGTPVRIEFKTSDNPFADKRK